ncbi:hypothetical protein RUM43_012611 [Polyplax serrata]|uniref:Mpv17-like protein 2 n=1 Tax=Polyplax serrata TaxID=468196 RepID=A0AAN8P0Z8_POLSC
MSGVGQVIHFSRCFGRDLVDKCRYVTHQMFHKYLLITNVGISASLSFTGDILQQHYEMIQNNDRIWDKGRTLRMTVAGISVGTICHYWYKFLDRKLPERTLKIVLKKVALDQLVCSPLYITVFFATTCALEKTTFSEFKQEIIHKGWRLYLAEWIIWPPAQVFNFYILPPRFRVLYDNIISLGYDVYTSYVKNEIPMESETNKTSITGEKSGEYEYFEKNDSDR